MNNRIRSCLLAALSLLVGCNNEGLSSFYSDDGGCQGEAAACGCTGDAQCGGATPRCDTASGTCVPCLPQNDNCPAGRRCTRMGSGFRCAAACQTAADCPGSDLGAAPSCCGGACADTNTDLTNCGQCGIACAAANGTPACNAGVCAIAGCRPGFADCNGVVADGCESNSSQDAKNCGGCGRPCIAANATPACNGGMCGIGACAPGFGDCDKNPSDGCEASLLSDAMNCGGCGMPCGALPHTTAICANGVCSAGTCDIGYGHCTMNPMDGCETNLAGDLLNCGKCGLQCSPVSNGTAGCKGGFCVVAGCNPPFADCDMNAADGCEKNLNSDVANCGACNAVCQYPNATPLCNGGACAMGACNAGYADCNRQPGDGCEVNLNGDNNNCGACGTVCNGGKACAAGMCSNLISCSAKMTYTNVTLVNLATDCSGTGNFPYNSCGMAAYGWTWVDATPGAPTAAQLTFTQGLACSGMGNRSTTFNGQAGPAFLEVAKDCLCKPPSQMPTTLTLDVAQYIRNGANKLVVSGATSCEGIAKVNGVFATIVVTYGGNNVDPTTDPNNCGGCGNVCAYPNSTPACQGGACALGACNAGFKDCNGQKGDGCEANIKNDSNNCGGCGTVCPGGKVCSGGACTVLINCPVTQVYTNLTLVNLKNECSGTGNYPYNGCTGAYGFSWNDTGAGTLISAQVQFQQGMACMGNGNRTTTLNGAAAPNFFEVVRPCQCNPGAGQDTTVILPNGPYVVGGANTFLVNNAMSCEGIARANNVFGTVTANYSANVDPATDPANCGGCGMKCPMNTPKCVNSVCM